ncbi:hypothetical protein, partial [Escherichia coli]|uniref:hypothetical protein n=1 Tax=Escherichia coli TaxID=562 RepID=UPI0023AEFB4A
AQRASGAKTVKMDVFPRVNRKNASGTLSARCMTMHKTEWRAVSAHSKAVILLSTQSGDNAGKNM